jgi:AraC-like DNA-binding protein
VGALRLQSIEDLNKEASYEMDLVGKVGLPYEMAHMIARARSLGLDSNMALPKGFQTISQQDAASRSLQASASMKSAQAEMLKAQTTGSELAFRLRDKKYDVLNSRILAMVDAAKAKHPFPPEIEQGIYDELAREFGMQPEQVKHWYQYVTGGSYTQYIPIPDSDLASKAAGTAQPSAPKKAGPDDGKNAVQRYTDTVKQIWNYSGKGKKPNAP